MKIAGDSLRAQQTGPLMSTQQHGNLQDGPSDVELGNSEVECHRFDLRNHNQLGTDGPAASRSSNRSSSSQQQHVLTAQQPHPSKNCDSPVSNISRLSFASKNCRLWPDKPESSIDGSSLIDSSLIFHREDQSFSKGPAKSGWYSKKPAAKELMDTLSKQESGTSDKENTPMDLMNSNLSQLSSISAGKQLLADFVTPRLGEITTREPSVGQIESELRLFREILHLNGQKRRVVVNEFEQEYRLLKNELLSCKSQLSAKQAVIGQLQQKCKYYEREIRCLKEAGSHKVGEPARTEGYSPVQDNLAKALSNPQESRLIQTGISQLKIHQRKTAETRERLNQSDTKWVQQIAQLQQKLCQQLEANATLSKDIDTLQSANELTRTQLNRTKDLLKKSSFYKATALRLESTIKLVVDVVGKTDCQCCAAAKLLVHNLCSPEDPVTALQASLDFKLSDVSQYESKLYTSVLRTPAKQYPPVIS